VNITGGPDLSLFEVDEAMNRIRDEVDPEANIIFGSTFSDSMEGKMRVSVVATGIDSGEMLVRPTNETTSSMYAPRKPFGGSSAPAQQKETATAARERTPAEIVRQAGTATIAEAARTAAPRAAAPQPMPAPAPMIRVVDEAVAAAEEEQQAAHAAQMEQAMRLAAQASRAAAANAIPTADAGPLFVSPRAEAPQQRTLFTAQTPELEDEDDQEVSGKGLFNRLANVGKSIAGAGRTATAAAPRSVAAPIERKAEVRETAPHAGEEEELYDIPAFLRRQAN
jgi:cell division protein FtsZ